MTRTQRDALLREIIAVDGPEDRAAAVNADPEKQEAAEYWAAKGCLELRRAWGGAIIRIEVTPQGRTYFNDRTDAKREKRADAVRSFFTSYWSGVLSGITVTLLLEHIILPLLAKAAG